MGRGAGGGAGGGPGGGPRGGQGEGPAFGARPAASSPGQSSSGDSGPERVGLGWSGWPAVWWFVLGLTVLRVVVLLAGPMPLVEDEAWYWEWSRRLEWSYATKGPGVAWLIALSTWAFGDAAWAIRLPAALSSAVATLCVAGLARATLGDRRAMLPAAIVLQAMPFPHSLGLVMTIDGPLLACWAAAAWAGWYAISGHGRWSWLWLGVALGVGVLFKYTVLLLPLGMLAFAVVRRPHVRVRTVWALLAVPPFALGLLPIVAWNAQHDWVSFRHLLGHLGLPGGDAPVRVGEGEGGRTARSGRSSTSGINS